MKTIIKGIVSALLLTTLAAPGFAENRQGSFNLSPFVGGYVLDSDLKEENRPIFGLRAGYNFTRSLGAEAMFGYSLTETQKEPGSRETDLYRYGFDFLYHFMPDRNFVPFIAVGGGGINFTTPNTASAPDHSAGLVSGGAGLKYFVSPDLALRGDVREVMLLNGSNDLNFEYSVGLTFQFGGTRKAVAAVSAPAVTEDTAAPTVVFTSPFNGTTAVPVNKKVNVAFSEEMDPATITGESFTLKQGKTPVSGRLTTTGSNTTFTPASDLEKDKAYTATITTGVKDRAGNAMASNYEWNFTAFAPPKGVPVVLATLEDSHFDFDSSKISENGKTILKLNITTMQDNPKIKIHIVGYTSASGSEEYNQKLSERRAVAVKEYLVKEGGINGNRITTIGYGEKRPAKYEAVPSDIRSDAAHANMRVLVETIEE